MLAAYDRYLAATPGSRARFEEAQRRLAGGVNRGGMIFQEYPLFIERAAGCYLYDVDGREVLDFGNSNFSLPLGHSHPAVLAAIRAQMENGLMYGLMNDREVELAQLIEERAPSIERLRFTSSGTEATMFALRLARAYTGRTRFARMDGSYHGTHDQMCVGAGPLTGLPQPGTEALPVSRGVPRWLAGEVEFLPFNDLEGCARVLGAHRGELAALMVEPVMGAAGMIPPEPGFLEGLRALCDRAVLIFDEMISFGLGPGGAQEYYGVRPDLTTTGKFISGGMPMGCFGGKAEIMALCAPHEGKAAVQHTGTFNAHPLVMAAGIAQMRLLTPEVFARLGALGAYARDGVRALAVRRGAPLQVTGVQHLFGFHFIDRPIRSYADIRASDDHLARQVGFSLLSQGVHVPGRGRACVSTAMTETEIDRFLEALEIALEEAGAI
jgi:glutamate-1-semialdehyde 2,1-aminomutase